jgi:glycosyltransferase involved in cell wall biosynthesis
MANDGTHGDVIVKTLCPEAKLLFLPNGLPEQFISKVESVLREQSMEVGVGDELHCIAISKLKKWKRIDRSIDLANRLAAHLKKPVVLSVIGDGPELANLTALAEQKASKLVRIEFLGSMRHVDIVKLLVRADLFLSFYDISNLGNPLLEAVYCKKRIVTFNEMPTRKTIGESERFCFVERFDGEWPETELSKIVEFLGRPQTSAGGNGGTIMSWRSRMKKEIEFIEAQYV